MPLLNQQIKANRKQTSVIYSQLPITRIPDDSNFVQFALMVRVIESRLFY